MIVEITWANETPLKWVGTEMGSVWSERSITQRNVSRLQRKLGGGVLFERFENFLGASVHHLFGSVAKQKSEERLFKRRRQSHLIFPPKLSLSCHDVIPKLSKSCLKVLPTFSQSGSKVVANLSRSLIKVASKLSQSYPKTGSKLSQSCHKVFS